MVQKFALIFGIVYVVVGILGFFPPFVAAPTGDPGLAIEAGHGRLLGLFPINLMHNLVHIAVGAWGLAASRSVSGSIVYGKGLAILYGLLTILGLLPITNTLFGLAPIHGHDVWLHALSAIVAGYFGFVYKQSPAIEHRV